MADKKSRNFYIQNTEWKLDPSVLHEALKEINFEPDIDLFASRLSNQFEKDCSNRQDPGAVFVDTFSISFSDIRFYCFPPFSCILRALQKIRQDSTTTHNPQILPNTINPVNAPVGERFI